MKGLVREREVGGLIGGITFHCVGVELLLVLVHGSETNRLINISLD